MVDIDLSKDLLVITGDFNALPDSKTYALMRDCGFTSCHQKANGCEPTHTFPTGLQAQWMDTDPPLTTDYIWVKGQCEIVNCVVDEASRTCHPDDKTIYGSDHMAIVADLII